MGEGSSGADKIIKVFNASIDEEPSLEHGHHETPQISTSTAQDIKAGGVCPSQGFLNYENMYRGFLPLAFITRSTEEVVKEAAEEEEYGNVTHRIVETERAWSSLSKDKKAPDNFADIISTLRVYGEVIKEHFTGSSPIYHGTQMVFQAFARRKETWKTNMDHLAGARFWWQFLRAIHDTMWSETRWAHDCTGPMMDVSVLLACIKGGQFPSVVDMPGKLVPPPPQGDTYPPGKVPQPWEGAINQSPQSGDPKVQRLTRTSSPSLKPSWTRPCERSARR
jgi:hypothetical protein